MCVLYCKMGVFVHTPKTKCVCIYACESKREQHILHQMLSLPELLAGCQLAPAELPQQEHTSRRRGEAIAPNDETHQSSPQPGLTCPNVSSWWHIHGKRMHIVGVLYEALWEPVFTLSGRKHLKTAQRNWWSLLAWREVVIVFLYTPVPWWVCGFGFLSSSIFNYS